MAGDYVIHQGEIDDKLYFVHHGIIANTRVVPPKRGQEQEPFLGQRGVGIDFSTGRRSSRKRRSLNHAFMSRSKHFGEAQGLLGSLPHTSSYRAETNVDVVSLSHADIEDLFNFFPEYRHTIMRRFRGKIPTNSTEGRGRHSHGHGLDESVQTGQRQRQGSELGSDGRGGGGGKSAGSGVGTSKYVKVVEDVDGNKFAVPQDDSILGQILQ